MKSRSWTPLPSYWGWEDWPILIRSVENGVLRIETQSSVLRCCQRVEDLQYGWLSVRWKRFEWIACVCPILMFACVCSQLCDDDAIQASGTCGVLCSGECWPLCFLWSQGACIHRRLDHCKALHMLLCSILYVFIFSSICSLGQQAYFNYSTSKRITRPTNADNPNSGNKVLLLSIQNPLYPITTVNTHSGVCVDFFFQIISGKLIINTIRMHL